MTVCQVAHVAATGVRSVCEFLDSLSMEYCRRVLKFLAKLVALDHHTRNHLLPYLTSRFNVCGQAAGNGALHPKKEASREIATPWG
jgi:hypothetical protein